MKPPESFGAAGVFPSDVPGSAGQFARPTGGFRRGTSARVPADGFTTIRTPRAASRASAPDPEQASVHRAQAAARIRSHVVRDVVDARVVNVRLKSVGPPRRRWVLTLACGHTEERPVTYDAPSGAPRAHPSRVWCDTCARSSHTMHRATSLGLLALALAGCFGAGKPAPTHAEQVQDLAAALCREGEPWESCLYRVRAVEREAK